MASSTTKPTDNTIAKMVSRFNENPMTEITATAPNTEIGKGVFYAVLDKAKRGKKLSTKQKRRNKKLSRVRAKVEHPFQIIKCQWGYRKTRYRGLKKNGGQITMLCALANIFMVRKPLLSIMTAG